MTTPDNDPRMAQDSSFDNGNTDTAFHGLDINTIIANLQHNIKVMSEQLAVLGNIKYLTDQGQLNDPDTAQKQKLTGTFQKLATKIKPIVTPQPCSRTTLLPTPIIQQLNKQKTTDSQDKTNLKMNKKEFIPVKNGSKLICQEVAPSIELRNSYESLSEVDDSFSDGEVTNAREKVATHSKRKKAGKTKEKQTKRIVLSNSPQKVDENGLNSENLTSEVAIPVEETDSQMDTNEPDTSDFQFSKKAQRIPPIVIEDDNYTWKKLTKLLKEDNKITNYKGKLKGENTFQLNVEDSTAHREVTKILDTSPARIGRAHV